MSASRGCQTASSRPVCACLCARAHVHACVHLSDCMCLHLLGVRVWVCGCVVCVCVCVCVVHMSACLQSASALDTAAVHGARRNRPGQGVGRFRGGRRSGAARRLGCMPFCTCSASTLARAVRGARGAARTPTAGTAAPRATRRCTARASAAGGATALKACAAQRLSAAYVLRWGIRNCPVLRTLLPHALQHSFPRQHDDAGSHLGRSARPARLRPVRTAAAPRAQGPASTPFLQFLMRFLDPPSQKKTKGSKTGSAENQFKLCRVRIFWFTVPKNPYSVPCAL